MQKGDLVRIRQDDDPSRGYWRYWVREDPTLVNATIIVHAVNTESALFQRLDDKSWPDGTKTARLLRYNFVSV